MRVFSRTMGAALILAAVILLPLRLQAQGIPVFDVQLIAHYAKLIITTEQTYQKLMEQYETVTRMGRGLSGMEKFRIPAIVSPAHDVSRYLYAGPLLEALNSGDPRATKYYDIVRTLSRDVGVFDQLPADVRKGLLAAYATVEVLDSTTHQAVNQVGATRVYNDTIGRQINDLEGIITTPDKGTHQMTAVLDTIATAELVAERQNTAATQIEANLVAQRIAKAKADRDAYVAHLEMMLTRLRDRGATANALAPHALMPANGGQP